MVVKKLLAINLALAIFGGVGQLEVASQHDEVVDTQRVRIVEENEVVEEVTETENVIVGGEAEQQPITQILEKIKDKNIALKEESEKIIAEQQHRLVELELDEINDYGYDFYTVEDDSWERIHVDISVIEHWGLDDMIVKDVVTAILDDDENVLLGFIKDSVVKYDEKENKLIEIELVEKYEDEVYFYDHNAEFEPRIYVDMVMMKEYGIEDMKVGEKITGVFDSEGWELFGFKKENEENVY